MRANSLPVQGEGLYVFYVKVRHFLCGRSLGANGCIKKILDEYVT